MLRSAASFARRTRRRARARARASARLLLALDLPLLPLRSAVSWRFRPRVKDDEAAFFERADCFRDDVLRNDLPPDPVWRDHFRFEAVDDFSRPDLLLSVLLTPASARSTVINRPPVRSRTITDSLATRCVVLFIFNPFHNLFQQASRKRTNNSCRNSSLLAPEGPE
jgi:hypothetical protein